MWTSVAREQAADGLTPEESLADARYGSVGGMSARRTSPTVIGFLVSSKSST